MSESKLCISLLIRSLPVRSTLTPQIQHDPDSTLVPHIQQDPKKKHVPKPATAVSKRPWLC